MSILRWLVRLLSSTVALAINVVISAALFLLSAYLLTHVDEDPRNAGYVVRGVASIWLWSALWTYVARGVLQRPKTPHDPQRKAKGLAAALNMVGCLGTLAALVGIYLVVGQQADWALAGIAAGDPAHTARAVFEQALHALEAALAHPQRIVPAVAAFLGVTLALRVLAAWADGTGPRPGTRRARQAPTGTRPAPPSSVNTPVPQAQTADDPVLGRLRWDASAGRWQVLSVPSGLGSLVIDTGGAVPTDMQHDLARGIAQRSFEVLLRGSDAARPAAQTNGVGLPRFTIGDAVVHADQGRATPVTLSLRCEGDASRTYDVRSTDGMNTFTLV